MKLFIKLLLVAALIFGGYWVYDKFTARTRNIPVVTDEQKNNQKVDDVIVEDSYSELGFEQYLPGNWQSVDDSKNLMVLKEDPNSSEMSGRGGSIENIYDGKTTDSGTWLTERYKLKLTVKGEEFVYTVVFAGKDRLELTYLPRGNNLKFARIVE